MMIGVLRPLVHMLGQMGQATYKDNDGKSKIIHPSDVPTPRSNSGGSDL